MDRKSAIERFFFGDTKAKDVKNELNIFIIRLDSGERGHGCIKLHSM